MRATRLVAGQLARASSRSLLCHAPRPALRSSLPSSCSSSTSKLLDTSSTLPIPLPSWPEHQQLRFASKKKKNSKSKKASKFEEDDDEVEVEDLPVPIVAKGKKGKAAQVTEEDITAEKFDLDKLGKSMDEAVERFQVDSRVVLARVEKLSPNLLDSVRVLEHGQRYPLSNYATVSVAGPEVLLVRLLDPAFAKPVEKAIRDKTDLNFEPQQADDTTLRIPVTRPDMETRNALVHKASELAEAARNAIRNVRHRGQKDLKADETSKVVGKDQARKDGVKLTDLTKKKTEEIDKLFANIKKVLLDE